MNVLEYTTNSTGVDLTSGSVANTNLGMRFQLKQAAPVGRISLYLKKTGSPAGYLQASIYSDDGSSLPDAVVTNGASDGVTMASLSTSYGWVDFDFDMNARPELDASTSYHIVLTSSGYTYTDGTTEVIWGCDQLTPHYSSGEGETYDGMTWTDIATATDFDFKIFTGEREGADYSSISLVASFVKHLTYNGAFDYSTTCELSPTRIYDMGEQISNQIDSWFASAGFDTPITNSKALSRIRQPASAGVAMDAELTQRTAGFRGERGSDTRTGAFRTLYMQLRTSLVDDEGKEFDDVLDKEASGQFGRGLTAGGILVDDLEDQEDDDDLIQPKFKKAMWDNT